MSVCVCVCGRVASGWHVGWSGKRSVYYPLERLCVVRSRIACAAYQHQSVYEWTLYHPSSNNRRQVGRHSHSIAIRPIHNFPLRLRSQRVSFHFVRRNKTSLSILRCIGLRAKMNDLAPIAFKRILLSVLTFTFRQFFLALCFRFYSAGIAESYSSAVYAMIGSVCPSVCPSVLRHIPVFCRDE